MSAPDLAIGHIVAGKFAIQSLLRRGGPTATYHAITEPNREVALRLYDPELKRFPSVLEALVRCENIVSSLPGHMVVPVIERGEDPATGAPYTVTDFHSTPSLAELVQLCPLSASEMVAVVKNLGRVLDLAHASGISHLSLKPTNLFVGPAPANEVRVIDFGMRLVRAALPDPTMRSWSAPWLAPEQMKEAATPGPLADLFATALVAFFAATGKSYWRSCSAPVPDVRAWEWEILADRLPVSERAREVGSSLPAAFDPVFARALAVQPSERFANVTEFAEALASALEGRAPAPARVEPRPFGRATALGLGGPAPLPPRAAPLPPAGAPLPSPRRTVMGLGAPAAPSRPPVIPDKPSPLGADGEPFVPPPPAQMEAALAAFETSGPPISVRAGAAGSAPAAAPPLAANAEEIVEIPGLGRGDTGKRSRWAWFAGAAAGLILIGGGVFALSGSRAVFRPGAPVSRPNPPDPPAASTVLPQAASASNDTAPTMSTEVAAEHAKVEAAPIASASASAAAPEPRAVPPKTSETPPPTAPAPAKIAPAPARPKAPAPSAPKKPCGKFLKRCT